MAKLKIVYKEEDWALLMEENATDSWTGMYGRNFIKSGQKWTARKWYVKHLKCNNFCYEACYVCMGKIPFNPEEKAKFFNALLKY